jgi:hypothetical protein
MLESVLCFSGTSFCYSELRINIQNYRKLLYQPLAGHSAAIVQSAARKCGRTLGPAPVLWGNIF